jgi:vitamin B12 transporter
MSYFRTTYENLIDFSPQAFRLVNRDEVRSQGVELEGRTRLLEDTVLSGHLTYVNLDVEGTSENLRDRPRWRGGFSLDWKRSGKVGLNLAALWVGSRYDFQVPVPDRDRVGGYATVNLDALWRVAPEYEVFLRVENLLNAEYHEFIGFPNPGAWWRVGMRWRLGG